MYKRQVCARLLYGYRHRAHSHCHIVLLAAPARGPTGGAAGPGLAGGCFCAGQMCIRDRPCAGAHGGSCAGAGLHVRRIHLCTAAGPGCKRPVSYTHLDVYKRQVEIKAISREAGARTKMAVWSKDENVDPVGACIGPRGQRVANKMWIRDRACV